VREVWHGERRVAEMSLDAVEFNVGRRRTRTHEVEIELAQAGNLDDLRAAGEALRVFELQPARLSKFERALALLDETAAGAESPTPKRRKTPGVRADMPMSEAGRAILSFHFERMLANEAGTREGTDIEALHDMRVATRRQRAAFRIFAPHYRRKVIRPFRRALRRLAERLGAVRDLDVQVDTVQAFQSAQDAASAAALQPLLDEWRREREAARAELLAHLDSDAYRDFKQAYADFLASEGAGARRGAQAGMPQRVQHVVPRVAWEHYGAVRAYEAILPWATIATLHTLRIEGKRLRYALEFLREVLDSCVETLITDVVALQDHLGELHDGDVAVQRLQTFLLRGMQAPLPPEVSQAVGSYLAARQARLRALQRTVNRPWRRINSARFRRLLGRAMSRL
jgi:CHAD domain-containing protein